MDLFETQSVINEDTFKELRKFFLPRRRRIALIMIMLFEVFLFIVAAFSGLYVLMVVVAVLIIRSIVKYLLILNKSVKLIMKRMQETEHAKEFEYTSSFCDAGIKIKNHATNAMITIYYDDINRFAETKNYYVLFTKANQLGIVNRSDIDGANKREDLINFLKCSCKNIRW